MPRPRSSITPEQLLADYPPPARELAELLRELVKGLVPEAAERAYPGWRGIGYRHPDAGYFCAIFLHPHQVKLGLEHGAQLPDPHHILKPGPTAGKQVRYLEINTPHDLDREQIAQLLTAALDLQLSRRKKITAPTPAASKPPKREPKPMTAANHPPDPPTISFTPIGYVASDFTAYAPSQEMRARPSRIILRPELAPGLLGLTAGQSILVLFHLHRAADYQLQLHPGHNPQNPIRGVFATRSQYRPNPIAATIAQIQTIDRNTLTVTGLDAQNGSPVLDLKPHAPAFDQPNDAPPPENNPE